MSGLFFFCSGTDNDLYQLAQRHHVFDRCTFHGCQTTCRLSAAFLFHDLTTQGLARGVFMEPGTRTNGPASLELVRMAGIDESVTEGLLEIKSLQTAKPSRKQGHASRLLTEVCQEADKDGTILVLTPKQFDNGPIGTEQLKAWYERFGFVAIQDKPVLMCRDAVVIKHVPLDRRYDLATGKFIGPKVTVEIGGKEHKVQAANGLDAKDAAEQIRAEVSGG